MNHFAVFPLFYKMTNISNNKLKGIKGHFTNKSHNASRTNKVRMV